MAMITCDKCGFEWLANQTVFEEIVLNEAEGVKMRFFQCPECNEEYIVDVTDTELRKMLTVFKKMKKKYIRMYNAHESQTRLRNYGERLQDVQQEIIARQKMLRGRWTRGE